MVSITALIFLEIPIIPFDLVFTRMRSLDFLFSFRIEVEPIRKEKVEMAETGIRLDAVRMVRFRKSLSLNPLSRRRFNMISISLFSVLNLPIGRSDMDEEMVWATLRVSTPALSAFFRSTFTINWVSPPSRSEVISSTSSMVLSFSIIPGTISVNLV